MIGSNSTQGESSSATDEQQQQMAELITKWQAMTFEDPLTSLIESVKATDLKKQYYGVVGLRKILCTEATASINPVLDSGVVPTLIEIMRESKEPKIQCEAAWSLTNLCSGTSEQTERVIGCGVITGFLAGLACADPALIEHCIWGLGNIAGDSSKFRDLVIKEGGIEAIANVLENTTVLSTKRSGTWALSNCCRGKPAPPYDKTSRAIPVLHRFLKNENDQEILSNSAWALASILEGKDEAIETVINSGLIPIVVKLLSDSDSPATLVVRCLRIIGNIIAGSDEQTSVVLKEKEFLPVLLKLTTHAKQAIRREVFWIVSNITAGQPVQFEGIMGNPAFVERIINQAKKDADNVRREAIYVLSNSTVTGTPAQIIRLLNNGVYKCLIEALDEASEEKILLVALQGIENCLKWGKQFNLVDENGVNKFVHELEVEGGLDQIENLQKHQSSAVYESSMKILLDYFETD